MATPEGVIQKINLLIEDANDATGSLHNNLRDAVDSLILGYGGYGNIEVDSLSELHTWSKYAIGGTVTETKVGTLGISGDRSGTDSIYEPVDYADEYDISNGKIVLVNPTENLTFTSSTAAQVLLGKYIQTYEIPHEYATAASPSGKFYRIDSTAKVEYSKSVYPTTARSLTASPAYRLEYTGAEDRLVGIVVSDDIDAYPQNGEQDGYKYVYNGTIGSEPSLQHKSVTPSTKNQVVLPDTNYDGLSHVTVEGDEDLVAGNIKNGVEIFGVTGSYVGTGGTALPTLTTPGTAEDLARGKQLIDADGNIVTGSVVTYDDYTGWSSKTPIQRDGKVRFEQSPSIPMLFRKGFYLGSPLSNFGDATAEDVVAGKTFTSAAGVKVIGTHKCTGGGDGYEVDSLSELHAWSKYTTANGSVVETQLTNHVIAGDYDGDNHMVDYADTYSIVNGEISLDNPSSANMYGVFDEHPVKGKYVYSRYQNAYYYVPADAVFTHGSDSNGSTIEASKVTLLTYRGATGTTEEFVSIVVSNDINAYPKNGSQDGYKYVYNGTLGGSGGDFIVTDDGAGNVTITSSAITDNNGDVVIA